jgi:ketosteroid isomerase-like protein
MKQHPNEKLLAELYERFQQGDTAGVIAMCDESMIYRVPGSVPTSGIYNNASFGDLVQKTMEIANGTFKETVIDIIANDYRGVVLLKHSLERNGEHIEYRTTHRYQISNGKFISWEEYPGSEAEFNQAWS